MTKGFRFKKADLGVFKSRNVSIALSSFEKDCRILGLTRGQFSLIDLIHGVLKKVGRAEVICTTWSAGIKDAHNVKWMIGSDMISSFKILTDHSYKTRQKKYASSLESVFGVDNIRTSEIHAKFVLIKNADFNVTIRTSMNLNTNKTCENFELDDDLEIYNFYAGFVRAVFDKQEKGFISSSVTVNKTLDLFFGQEQKITSSWSDL